MMPTSQPTDGSTDASNDDHVSPVPPTTAADWENRAVDYSWVLQGQPERWKTSINQLHSLSFDVVHDVPRPPSKADVPEELQKPDEQPSRVAMVPNHQQSSSAGRESVPPRPPLRVVKSCFAMERKHRCVEIRTDKVVGEEKIEHEPRGLNDYFSKSDWDMLERPTSVDGKKRVVSKRLCSLY